MFFVFLKIIFKNMNQTKTIFSLSINLRKEKENNLFKNIVKTAINEFLEQL